MNLQTCPLCGGMLGTKYPPPGSKDQTKFYLCSKHIPGTKLSHYYIERVGNVFFEIVQLPPFTMVNCSATQETHVYPYTGDGSGHILNREKIMQFPKIPITTEEKLLERLKTLVIFS